MFTNQGSFLRHFLATNELQVNKNLIKSELKLDYKWTKN
jgi:hypothetical protein